MTEEQPEKKSLHKGRFLAMFERGGWEYVDRVGASGVVVILAVTDANELVLVEQHRVPVGASVIELPAGLAGDLPDARDEDFREAARRELLEETGYEAENIEFLCEGPPSAGLTSEIQTLLRATGIRKTGPGGGDESEDITVHTIALDQLDDWLSGAMQRGCLVDPKIYAGLYFLR
jgi:ADP-ribose pyrophosphatase